eukprot:351395-Chlamydomonas_euryale.AAC.6
MAGVPPRPRRCSTGKQRTRSISKPSVGPCARMGDERGTTARQDLPRRVTKTSKTGANKVMQQGGTAGELMQGCWERQGRRNRRDSQGSRPASTLEGVGRPQARSLPPPPPYRAFT